jgi:hypothetical protein
MRRFIFLALLFITTGFSLRAQVAVSAEALIAYPFYFKDAETGITTSHFQEGLRGGAYYYNSFDDYVSFVVAANFTHHFTTIDSAVIEASDRNYDPVMLHGTAATVFNSLAPQIGLAIKSQNNPLLSYRLTYGIGASWARCLYDLPTYDSLTMQYFNPPWWAAGKYNAERKLFAVRPCMLFNFAVQYEFRYFYAYGNLNLTYSMSDYPPTPLSVGGGILVPLFRNEEHKLIRPPGSEFSNIIAHAKKGLPQRHKGTVKKIKLSHS